VARPAKFTPETILTAASEIVALHGPGAATMGEIAARIGAPNGSLYHRFRSRDELLGRLWLLKAAFYQNAFARTLDEPNARQAAINAASSLPKTCRSDFAGARIMLLHRREDFMSEGWPKPMQEEAARLRKQARDVLGAFTVRLFGKNTKQAQRTTSFAILDVPFAAVRRYVEAGEMPPPQVDDLIEAATTAILDRELAAERTPG